MMRRRFVVVAVAVAAALSALLFVLLRRSTGGESAHAGSLAVPPPGREAVLHVVWHEKSTARLTSAEAAGLADTFQGEVDLEADLALSRESTSDGGDAIRVELRDVLTSRVMVSGQELLERGEAGQKSLEKRPIHLVVEDGRITRVLVDRDAASVAVGLVENVARQVLLARPVNGGAFEREEQTPSGTLRFAYAPSGDSFRRTLLAAVSLEGLPGPCEGTCLVRARGEGEVHFEEGGAILRLTDKRELRAGEEGAPAMYETTASLEATRVREGESGAVGLELAGLESKMPGEPFESQADKQAALTRRAAGASIEDVLSGLEAAAGESAEALPKGWLVRSTALLELRPELLAEVAVRFEDDELGARGRIAILDVLAATSGEAAQATLLRVLDGAAARQDTSRLVYVQRLLLVEQPSPELARAMRGRLGSSQTSGDPEMAYAEAHVLGAVAGRLAKQGKSAEAKAATDVLASALEGAQTPAARAAYVAALGNAGDPAHVSRLAKHARDADPSVRRAVASSLRKTGDPTSRATLITLASDPSEDVQVTALDALGQQPVEPGAQRELAQLIATPHLGGEAEGQVVTLLLQQGPPSPEVRGSLEQLLERTEDPRLAARIRLALEASRPN